MAGKQAAEVDHGGDLRIISECSGVAIFNELQIRLGVIRQAQARALWSRQFSDEPQRSPASSESRSTASRWSPRFKSRCIGLKLKLTTCPLLTGMSKIAGRPIRFSSPHAWPLTTKGLPSESPHSITTPLRSSGPSRQVVQYAMRSQRRGVL